MTESWIGILDDESDRMTAWEVEFVESLIVRRAQHERSYAQRQYWTPTDKQFETLEKIWERVFG